jgi:hypothetical protein
MTQMRTESDQKENARSRIDHAASTSSPVRPGWRSRGSLRFITKERGLPVDELFLDLEGAVAPAAKTQARANAAVAVAVAGDWGGRTVAVRVNDATTGWAHRDVIDVVSAGGGGAETTSSCCPK